MDAESSDPCISSAVVEDNWQLDSPTSCSDLDFSNSDKSLQDWTVEPNSTQNDSESEEVLHAVDPNEVFPSGPRADSPSESDSSVSLAPAAVYQLVYNVSGMKTEPGQENVISIELDEWSSQVLFADSCIVNELPVVPTALLVDPPSPDGDLLYPELQLTKEEQQLLTQEGVSLPNNLPLTKAEERILKRVRRKIRNKQSAQDSRRRRKEYVDGLESRAAACSAQNKELQRTVEQLEKHNMSLLSQLRQLQSLIKQTVSKGAQTSTCLLIILVSLGLIILPSFSPFSRNSFPDDDYRPTGVISRNILTEPSSSQPTADDSDGPAVQSDSSLLPSQLGQSEPPEGDAIIQPEESPEMTGLDGLAHEGSQSGNSSALASGKTEPQTLPLRSVTGRGSHDPAKSTHADEM